MTDTPEAADARIKRAAQRLLDEIEDLSDEAWGLLPEISVSDRARLIAELQYVAGHGLLTRMLKRLDISRSPSEKPGK